MKLEKETANISDDNDLQAKLVVSVAEYRKLRHDDVSTEEQVARRLQYLEALCRIVIREELTKP